MKAHVLRGSKQEIAENLVRMRGEVREVIVFVEEPAPAAPGVQTTDAEDIFTEMRPFMVDVQDVDDSREAIYSPAGRAEFLTALDKARNSETVGPLRRAEHHDCYNLH